MWLGRAGHSVLDGRHLHPDHLAGRRLDAFDGDPGGLLLLEARQLLLDRAVRHRCLAARDSETAHPLQLELGANFDVQLELDRASFFELEIADGWIGDRLERFVGLGGFPALADDFLEHRLADGIAEPLADDGIGRLARPESGEPRTLGVVLQRAGLGFPDPVHRYGYPERLRGGILAGFLDRDLAHRGGNLPCRRPQGQFCRAASSRSLLQTAPIHARFCAPLMSFPSP